MGPIVSSQSAYRFLPHLRRSTHLFILSITLSLSFCVHVDAVAQSGSGSAAVTRASEFQAESAAPSRNVRSRRFTAGRTLAGNLSPADAMSAARRQHVELMKQQGAQPADSPLNTSWQPIGPGQVASIAYGSVTGRVTSIATDPADVIGNTVYLGTTGGGVWKSTNAAGPAANVTFTALTDTLPVFSANAGSAVIPSLSIGAVSVQSGVILAGTGDPNDSSDSFYGSGLLRSTDGGLTWTLIQSSNDGVYGLHFFTGLGFAGFAWSTATPGTVVAAVSQAAEGVLVNVPNASSSVMGLYYSTDAGHTWQMSVIMDGSQTVQTPLAGGANNGGRAATAVVWNPVRQRFYAAIRYHGYYESADGIIWTRLIHQPGTGLTTTACPVAPGTAGSASCPIFRGALAVQSVTGDTFALTVDSNNLDQGLWQDACALSGANCSSSTMTFSNKLASSPLETISGSTAIPQADYNLTLAAVPSGAAGGTQDTLLYAGTVDLYRCSLASGCLLRNTTNATNGCAAPAQVAPAQHAIAALATSSQPLLYIGNDGGLWRSTDGVNQQSTPCSPDDSTHFQNLNGGLGSLAEVISFAQHPTDPGTLLVGLGANGAAATANALPSTTAWPQLSAGEGGTVAIDQTDPLLWYVSTAAGVSIRQCASGAACAPANFTGAPTIGATQVAGDDSIIDAPWILDPLLPSNILIGTCRAWRGPASTGALWSSSNAISKLLGGPQNAICSSSNPVLRSVAAGGPESSATAAQNAGSKVLYAGMAGSLDGGGTYGGHLFSTSNAATASSITVWTDLALSPVTNDIAADGGVFNPGGFDISSLAADPHDATGATIYATVMGFAGNGINAPHLYRSTDGGAHWTNVSSNLPNAPANSVIVDPNDANTLYVALDTGVYVTTQITTCTTANCWSVCGTSLPNAPIIELAAAPAMPTGDGRSGELRAATYGRGIWQIPLLTAATAAQPAISLDPATLTFTSQAVATASAPQTITVTNTGDAPLTITQIITTGDFAETNTCIGAPIAPNLTCSVQVSFLPTATGTRTGILTIYGNVAGGQATAALNGTGTPHAAIILTPIILTFPSTPINATSAVQNITISNTGSTPGSLQTPSVSGDFKITANTCGTTLAPSTGCTVAIAFIPTSSGTRTGTFSIADDSGTQTASLTGIGTSPATDALSPLSLTFALQQLTTASPAQLITLTNSGDVALTLISAQITSGDFTVVNACGNSLNAHSVCSIAVAFQPKSVGPGTGVLTISDQYRTQTINLSGTGVAPPGVSLSPTSTLSFPAIGVGLTATSQTVTLTNNGGLPLLIQNIALTGDFAIVTGSNTCGTTLAVAAACTMRIAFTPTAGGPRTGTLTITDNAINTPQAIQLSGMGVDFTLNENGIASVTIASGQSAVYPLLLTSASTVSGTAAFTCTGAPANSTCTVTPTSVALGNTTTVSVTVLTGIATSASLQPKDPSSHNRILWLAALLPLSLLVLPRTKLPRLASIALLCILIAIAGCGAGREIPLGEGGTGPSSPITLAGTYNIVVSATSAGLTRTLNLTLIVH
jgi:Abnormal spindle-like microcephaly-assoc'd, ASPM-SPD-2-Hydin